MKDTPKHIEELQLKIWLSKPPMERLKQMMLDNEALMQFWSTARRTNKNISNPDSDKPAMQAPPNSSH